MGKGDLKSHERANVIAALRYLHAKLGTWRAVCLATGLPPSLIYQMNDGTATVTARTAFKVARLADVTLEELLAGEYPPAETCPHCGKPLTPMTSGEQADA